MKQLVGLCEIYHEKHKTGVPTLSPYDWLMTKTNTRKSSRDYEGSDSLAQLLLQVEYHPYFTVGYIFQNYRQIKPLLCLNGGHAKTFELLWLYGQ